MLADEIKKFAEAMDKKYKAKHKDYGESWRDATPNELFGRFLEEFEEFTESGTRDEIIDMANILMMMWNLPRKVHPLIKKFRGE